MGVTYIGGATFKRLARKIKKRVGDIEEEMIIRFYALGQDGMEHYRDAGAYRDRTGMLRRACAVGVYKDGRVVKRRWVNEYGRKGIEAFVPPTKGVCLAMVVGAPYARHVENMGYNVYTSTQRFIESEGRAVMRQAIREGLKR